jgi:hypothetical protein
MENKQVNHHMQQEQKWKNNVCFCCFCHNEILRSKSMEEEYNKRGAL